MSALLDAGQGRVALSFHANTFCSIVHLDRALLRRLLVGHPRIELRLKQARLPCDSVCEARAFEREPRRPAWRRPRNSAGRAVALADARVLGAMAGVHRRGAASALCACGYSSRALLR
jgi:hypothetical protein